MTLAAGTRIDPPFAGSSTTSGSGGKTITFDSELADANYHVSIICTAAQAGGLGEVWIDRSTTGFVLYNDGAADIPFTWGIVRY